MLIVVSSPSGGGKSSVIEALLKTDAQMEYSVSVTSRPPRPGEKDGVAYHFVTETQFHKWIDEGRFYEWAVVYDHLYGTRRDIIMERLSRGRDVIMDLDFQGGLNIKRQSPDAVLVFLLPPALDVLEQRLRARGTDTEAVIRIRLSNVHEEMRHAMQYDYVLINDNLNETIEYIREIIQSERRRTSRLELSTGEEKSGAGGADSGAT